MLFKSNCSCSLKGQSPSEFYQVLDGFADGFLLFAAEQTFETAPDRFFVIFFRHGVLIFSVGIFDV